MLELSAGSSSDSTSLELVERDSMRSGNLEHILALSWVQGISGI